MDRKNMVFLNFRFKQYSRLKLILVLVCFISLHAFSNNLNASSKTKTFTFESIVGTTDVDDNPFNLPSCEDGTAAKPFKDLGKARNVSSAGVYYFDLNGTTFSTYVDVNGYVQVAIDFGDGSGNLPQGTSLTNTTRGILTPAVLASLTDANEIRVSHSGGTLDATSIASVLIDKLLSNTTLHAGVNDVAANGFWTGTGASVLTSTGSTGTSTAGNELQENIFHTRGDGSGIHWIPSANFHRISFSSGEIPASESLHLWVRALRTIDSDCDGVNDDVDLDDDNDGILDEDEIACESVTEYEFFGTFGTLNGNTNSVLRSLNSPAPAGYTFGGNGTSPLNPAGTYAVTNGATSPNVHSGSLWNGLSGHTTGLPNDAYVAINGNSVQAIFYEDQVTLVAGVSYEFGAWVSYATDVQPTNPSASEVTIKLVRVSDGQVVSSFDSGPIHLKRWRETSSVFTPSTTEVYKYQLTNKSIQTSGNDFAIDDVFLRNSDCSDIDLDLDGDGVPNRLDLDSDGDGCPDAVEGAGDFIAGNLVIDTNLAGGSTNVQQNLGNSSNDDGTPNIEGTITTDKEKQGVGAAFVYGTDTECCADAGNYPTILDSDGDNIGDDCDLDDDNDGILDTDECADLGENNFNNWGNPSGDWVISADGSIASNTVNSAISSISFSQDGLTGLTMLTFHVKLKGQNKNNSSTTNDEANLDLNVNGIQYVEWENTTATSPVFPVRGNLTTSNGGSITPSTFNITASFLERYTITIPWNPADDVANLEFKITTGLDDFILQDFNFSESVKSHLCTDTDDDSIGNSLDLDSDDDGCPDAIEAAVPTILQSSGVSTSDGIADNTSEAVINVAIDSVGINGFSASLEDLDTNVASILNTHTTINYTTYALDSTKNGCGVPMITEVYWKGSEKIIEVTNIDSTKVIVPNGANINLFNNGVTTSRTASLVNSAEISGRASILFANSSSVSAQTKSGVSITENATAIAFDSISDVIAISRSGQANTSIAWGARIDVAQNMKENTAYVRIDEALSPNTTYTDSEWVAFVDDNLDPYRDLAGGGPERHPHDPLISEITSGVNVEANALLGLHRFTPTTRTGTAWDNGYPDRSRYVKISEDYAHSGSTLKARKLTVNTDSKLAITDNLLVVTDAISLANADDEVRLVGTSQLVQTHTGATEVAGAGKLLVDQNSTVPSIYRYNYLSSPVNTIGANTYTIETILKDGTLPVDADTEIFVATDNTKNLSTNIARGIHFIDGYDGKFETDSTFIADAWIYTYASASGGRSNWVQKKKNGIIPATDGFIMKGPGRAQNYTFMGSAKDGELKTSVGANESYLVGNPFSSAISAKKFIEDNINSTTGTLYFWQHAGEDDTSTDTSGHNYSGYVGGYATRNISMGLAANDPSALVGFDINMEAEEAFIQGSANISGSVISIVLDTDESFVEFKEIIRGVDTLKIRYKSDLDKEITLKINGQDSGDHTLPSSTEFTTFDIVLCVERGADVGIFSNDSNTAYIDFLQLKDADGKNSCEPSIEESNDFIAPGPYIPIGQGFFVQGSDNGGEVVFDNSQREFKTEGSESVFFRSSKKPATSLRSSSNKLPIIKLGMDYLDAQGMSIHRKIGISFNQYNSFEYEKGYDSEIYDLGVTDIYWKFPNSESTYVIAGVQEISGNLEVPFDIVMDYTGSVAIQIDEMEAIDREVFIKDHKTDRTYLLNDKTISLQLEKGTHTERFSLVFKGNAVLSVDDTKNVTDKDIAIYMDSNSKELVIQNHGNSLISKVELFNLLGQKIANKAILENTLENRLKVKKLSTNVYIVNVKTDKGVVSKKVVIE